MKFELDLVTDIPKLVQHDLDTGRVYTAEDGSIPDGGYSSVTTVLGADKSQQEGLRKWRERVGEEEANNASHKAAFLGTAVHNLMEDYMLGQEPKTKYFPNVHDRASGLKEFADRHIGKVRMVEGQMFSHHLRVAGTVDLVAEYDGKLAIIDWKTSKYRKKREHINNYFKQESAYAVMFEERTGIPVDTLVTAVAYPEGVQTFVEKRDDWIEDFLYLRDQYELELQSMS